MAMLLNQRGAFEVAPEILMRVARKARNNPEMMLAAGLSSLRLPILPSEIPATQHDVVAMPGKAIWALAADPPEPAEADFKALVSTYPKFPSLHYSSGT